MEPHWMSQESNPGDKSATFDSSNKKYVFVLSCFPCATNKTKKEEKQAWPLLAKSLSPMTFLFLYSEKKIGELQGDRGVRLSNQDPVSKIHFHGYKSVCSPRLFRRNFQNNHGAPFAFSRHAGDLGNIQTSDSGLTRFRVQDSKVTLQEGAKNGIVGLAFVIHEGLEQPFYSCLYTELDSA